MAGVKAFRRPRLWLAVWVALVLWVVVVSLATLPAAPDVPGQDKTMHVVTYLGLAVVTVQVFRRWRVMLAAAGFLLLLGAGLEVAQGTLTTARVMDARDLLANCLGVALGTGTGLLPGRDLLLRLESRPSR